MRGLPLTVCRLPRTDGFAEEPRTPMNPHYINSKSAFAALCVLVAACHGKHETGEDIRLVRTQVVGSGQYSDALTYTGEIRARHESDLAFQVPGKVIARPAEVGAAVKAGTILAQLDPTDEKVALDSAQSAVIASRAEVAPASTEEGGYRHLLERGLT